MSSWAALRTELDRWADAGLRADFWWRDDDAVEPSPALDRLLALRSSRDLPLALAVIPAPAGRALAGRLRAETGLKVLQHGYAHHNHAPDGDKTIELGSHRPVAKVMAELRVGRRKLEELFGRQFIAVMVPPWNRIDDTVIAALARADYRGLSVFGARAHRFAAGRMLQSNVHLDVMNWTTRRFLGARPILKRAVLHLHLRRSGEADRREPTGLMTHHLAHDRAGWDFIARFLDETGGHPAARWVGSGIAFRGPAKADPGHGRAA
ncbi:polysaccharide deacetylase [Hypericibacter adhaerens]|uniref:Polysaccharide deacetylase n=1 Tax=Hypericibacter adhaerens TaxID=2602016 RepID=A0A5J6N7Q0_9PROT|nr:polysaccharide deacetylase family protein [Hypericibacter adhaerens]QEX25145.1 polysaccharide deacetylase [Hypericibacter adhaerens]